MNYCQNVWSINFDFQQYLTMVSIKMINFDEVTGKTLKLNK